MTKMYSAYRFKDKDPAIDEMRTLVQDECGDLSKGVLNAIEDSGGPTAGCMRGWFFGKTLRPQNATIEAAGRALGYRRTWVKKFGRRSKR